jgi:hypothetical protein
VVRFENPQADCRSSASRVDVHVNGLRGGWCLTLPRLAGRSGFHFCSASLTNDGILCVAMRWWFWLIEVPAAIINVWLFNYRGLLLLTAIATFTVTVLVLALAAFGIRRGW